MDRTSIDRVGAMASQSGGKALQAATIFWFSVTALGQWIFVAYIVAFYGGTVLHGTTGTWAKSLTHGLEPGDGIGNVALSAHLAFAAVITAAGPLQLVPAVRMRMPSLHRWIGRVYVVTALVMSASALYLAWIRNAHVGSIVQKSGISLDAVLILLCAGAALRFARRRQFAAHRRWAIRLFLVVSGSWFFRVGVFFNLLVNHGPFGFDAQTFEGPFLNFMTFAESLLPLAVFELYLMVQARAHGAARSSLAVALTLCTVVVGVGVAGVIMAAWLPSIVGGH